jgi:hypothetical protein
MLKPLFVLMMAASAAFPQYKLEPAGPPPSEVPAADAALLQKDGYKIVGGNGMAFAEVWLRTTAPSGPKSGEDAVSLPTIPQGSFMGALRFPGRGSDRRGQTIKAGVYTLRYSTHPVNGDHQGVAPQRDFLLMVPAADDPGPTATPGFEDLVKLSTKASATPHPAVLSLASSSNAKFPELKKEGDSDWALHAKIGDTGIALIVVGKVE